MAKITALTAYTTPLVTDVLPIVADPLGTPITKQITTQNLLVNLGVDMQQVLYLTADQSTRGGTIADFFDANSAFPTVLNGVYELVWDVYFTKTTAGTVTWTITHTQTYTNIAASWRGNVITGIGATGAVSEAAIDNTTTAAAALPATGSLSTATEHHYTIRALAACGTAGNVRLRVTCGAGTVTPRKGSMFTARLLNGNQATFGAFVA